VLAARHHSPHNLLTICADLTSEREVESAAQRVCSSFAGVDALFNNAGIGPSAGSDVMSDISATTLLSWDATIRTNLTSAMLVIRSFVPLLLRSNGSIVNNASISGLAGMPGTLAYSASKGGLIAMTRALASELAPRHVRVNCICPGPIDTPMNKPWLDDPDQLRYLTQNIPCGRVATAYEVAAVAHFLCSEAASYINGAIIPVDGGWTAV
jgi:NAD(P)-dependent dehydrogenase (short-subunit alcohol dehydrogenase family)